MFKLNFRKVPAGLDGIVADFRSMLTRLDTHIETNQDSIDENYAVAAKAQQDIADSRAEISRANKIKKNISSLIEV